MIATLWISMQQQATGLVLEIMELIPVFPQDAVFLHDSLFVLVFALVIFWLLPEQGVLVGRGARVPLLWENFQQGVLSVYVYVLCSFCTGMAQTMTPQYGAADFYFGYIRVIAYTSELVMLGIDGVSMVFGFLTVILFPCLFLGAYEIRSERKILALFLMLLEFLLLVVFFAADLFLFYLAFEISLLPMIYLIAMWGTRSRRIKAIYYFFLYTFFGSFLLLSGLVLLYYEFGTTNMVVLLHLAKMLPLEKQCILWLLFFFPFAMKIPLFPFHIWLPEAHVEAPTIGSVVLAGLLLKLGGYGFYRVLVCMLPLGHLYYRGYCYVLTIVGAVYASLTLLRQFDLKKIVAYSSIAHMSIAMLGVSSMNAYGVSHGLLLLLAHGFSSSGLFFCVGMLYDRYQTRLIFNFGGLYRLMPLFSLFLLILCLMNFGFPLTANFMAEWMLLAVFVYSYPSFFWFLAIPVMLSIVYSMLLYVRVCTGELNVRSIAYAYYADLTSREFFILGALIYFSVLVGVLPVRIIDLLWDSIVVEMMVVPEETSSAFYAAGGPVTIKGDGVSCNEEAGVRFARRAKEDPVLWIFTHMPF